MRMNVIIVEQKLTYFGYVFFRCFCMKRWPRLTGKKSETGPICHCIKTFLLCQRAFKFQSSYCYHNIQHCYRKSPVFLVICRSNFLSVIFAGVSCDPALFEKGFENWLVWHITKCAHLASLIFCNTLSSSCTFLRWRCTKHKKRGIKKVLCVMLLHKGER